MAYSSGVAAEVRPTNGLDTNGGGFVAGGTGTDWTATQNGPKYSVTDGVTAGTTTITSATAGFAADWVGNLLYVSGGTGSVTAARYEVRTINSATSITVDRSTGLTAGTGVTLHLGGPVQTPGAIYADLAASGVTGNHVFVKGEAAITTAATITLSPVGTTGQPANRLTGFTNTRGDGGKVTIQLITNTGLTALAFTTNGNLVENFIIDCNSLGTSKGISSAGNYCIVQNCQVKNFTTSGITSATGPFTVSDCEVTAGTSAATAGIDISSSNKSQVLRCNIHDNACTGIKGSTDMVVENCLITNNTGASSDGIQTGDLGGNVIKFNTIYGSGRNAFNNTTTTSGFSATIRDNIFANSSSYGMVLGSVAGTPAMPMWDGNVYFGNTLGTRNNADDTTTNKINNFTPYTNVLDIICTVSPFVNASAGNFAINITSGGGALVIGHGTPSSWPGSTLTGNITPGAMGPPGNNTGGGSILHHLFRGK